MRRSYQTYTDLAIIAVLSLVPFLWFRDGYTMIAGFDFSVYLNPLSTLKKSFYVWSDFMAGGYDSSHEVSSLFYYLMFSVPVMLGASIYAAEKIIFVLFFALQGFAMYYMLRVLFARHAAIRVVALAGAILYMYSYPVMAHFGRGNMMTILAYGLLPILLGLLYRGFTTPDKRLRYVALIAALSFPLAAIKGHPADFVVIVGVAMFFTLFNAALAGRREAAGIIGFAVLAIVAGVLVNLWWLVPNIIYIRDLGLTGTDMVDEGFYNLRLLASYSSGSSILNTFRNDRLDLYFDSPGDAFLNPGLYQSNLFVAIGLLLPVLAFAALCFRKKDPNVLFLAIVGVAAVFMSKGSHDPFGGVFEWLYLKVPGFFFFRAPYRVFSSLVTFAVAPLVAITIGSIIERLGEAHKYEFPLKGLGRWPQSMSISGRSLLTFGSMLILVSVVSASSLYAWPVFTGSHMKEHGTRVVPGVFHSMPAEYVEAKRWVEKALADITGGKLYYPYQLYDINTRWGFNGPDPTHELFDAPKVVSRPGGTVYVRYQKPIERLNSAVWNWRYGDLQAVLGVYGTRYAVLHDDINPWVLPENGFNARMRTLFSESGLEPVNAAGQIEFYENKDPMKSVYEANRGYVLSGDEGAFPALSLAGYLDRPFLVMTRDLGPDRLKETLAALDGIIFFNTNLVDAACTILETTHGKRMNEGEIVFDAPETGMYVVYTRGGKKSDEVTIVDGVVLPVPGEAEGKKDGFRWKHEAEVFLVSGTHTLEQKGLWNQSTDGGAAGVVAIIPKNRFERIYGLIERRVEEPGFEHAYVFDDELAAENNGNATEITLYGSGAYSIAAMTPRWFAEEKVEGIRDVRWELLSTDPRFGISPGADGSVRIVSRVRDQEMVGVSVKAHINPLEAGRYPELDYTLESTPGVVVDRSLILHVRTDDNLMKTLLVDDVVGERTGPVNIHRKLRSTIGYSGSHWVESIEWKFTVKQQAQGFGITLGRPTLYGNSAGLRTGCAGAEGPVVSIAGMPVAPDTNAGCGVWSRVGSIVGSGGFSVANENNKGRPALVMIRRQDGTVSVSGAKEKSQELVVEKVSPTHRKVSGGTTSAPFMVFTDSYDKDWELNFEGESLHPVKVNGFANGFILSNGVEDKALATLAAGSAFKTRMERASYRGAVNKDEANAAAKESDREYRIEYGPQRPYRYSVLASVVAFGAVAFAGWRNG